MVKKAVTSSLLFGLGALLQAQGLAGYWEGSILACNCSFPGPVTKGGPLHRAPDIHQPAALLDSAFRATPWGRAIVHPDPKGRHPFGCDSPLNHTHNCSGGSIIGPIKRNLCCIILQVPTG